MGKAQGFFSRHQQPNVWAMTGLIIFAELSRLTNLGQAYSLLMVLVAIMGGVPLVLRAVSALTYRVISIELLVAVAIVGALIIGEYNEAAIVVWLFNRGDVLESLTLKKTRAAVKSLTDMAPQTATVLADVNDATGEVTAIDFVDAGDLVLVKAGERVPVDGVVKRGDGLVNEASLTGEARPLPKVIDQTVSAGTILADGILVVEASRVGEDTTFGKIIELVEEAQDSKSKAQRVIDRFAKYYTPLIMLIALVVGLTTRDVALAITVLVLGCPGVLVIGVPVSTVAGIGRAAKLGVLTKGNASLSALSKVDTLVFDKTGTLTKGVFEVANIIPAAGYQKEQVLEYAAQAESYSNHPIAKSILATYGKPIDQKQFSDFEEISGHGISVMVQGKKVLAGNSKLMESEKIAYAACDAAGTKFYVAADGSYVGCILIADEVKPDSKCAIAELKKIGVEKTVMLTGDDERIGKSVADELGLDAYYAQLLPDQKVEKLEMLDKQKRQGSKLAFVGDGINDAPVLARADVGIAMGGLGSDAAIEAADVVLMTDEPSKLVEAIDVAKATKRIVMQNIVIALGIKSVFLVLGALGMAGMWEAVFGDVGVTIIAVLNAMRILKK